MKSVCYLGTNDKPLIKWTRRQPENRQRFRWCTVNTKFCASIL